MKIVELMIQDTNESAPKSLAAIQVFLASELQNKRRMIDWQEAQQGLGRKKLEQHKSIAAPNASVFNSFPYYPKVPKQNIGKVGEAMKKM